MTELLLTEEQVVNNWRSDSVYPLLQIQAKQVVEAIFERLSGQMSYYSVVDEVAFTRWVQLRMSESGWNALQQEILDKLNTEVKE